MALVSPGIEVNIIDQSQYLPSASNSVPLVVLATAQNKANPSGTGVATATTAVNANKLYQVTSQRDLVTLFGNPFFYKTTNGTPIHGYELNEYGLMAAYSLLGTTNSCYVLRADVDLASLVGKVSRPVGEPADGTYWLDTSNSSWGIYEFNATTGKFTGKTPIVITKDTDIDGLMPADSIGNKGDYAVIPTAITETPLEKSTFFFKNKFNRWVALGSTEWKDIVPTVVATQSPTTLTAGDMFTINVSGQFTREITVPASPNNTVDGIVSIINDDLKIGDLRAENIGGVLTFYYKQYGANKYLTFASSDDVLSALGIPEATYYAPEVTFGTSAQMPLWTASQAKPHPTGSVWVKTSLAGSGFDIALAKFSATSGAWVNKTVNVYFSDVAASTYLDASGGKAIPAGTIYATVNSRGINPESALVLNERIATGPTVVTGSITDPSYQSGLSLTVGITIPGSTTTNTYTFVTQGTTAASFVTDWSAAGIPYTTAVVTDAGAVQLTHTLGGEIFLNDRDESNTPTGLVQALGFIAGTTLGVKKGINSLFTATGLVQSDVEHADGSPSTASGATFSVSVSGNEYIVNSGSGGANYAVGDIITIAGENFGGTSPTNDVKLSVQAISGSGTGPISRVSLFSGIVSETSVYTVQLSNWEIIDYVPSSSAPATNPVADTRWFYSVIDQVDIMVNKGGVWKGYRTVAFDSNGHPASAGVPSTDPTGPIISASTPTTQVDGSPLSYGDLWVDTSDLENYPKISRWEQVEAVDQWVLIDNTDQTSSSGILFADARWGTGSNIDPVSDEIPSIPSLLVNSYLDLDAPLATAYPQGMLLFNTRRSGYNVKQFKANYFNGLDFAGQSLPSVPYTWVSESGLKSNGAAYMGRKAQRALVVKALKEAVATNMSIREEDTFFNLIATPGYPELQPDMITLNNDRNNTAFIVGDTPLRLPDQATDLTNWANNVNGATATGEDGWVTRDTYLGVFYPSGITTDLTGTEIVVPASHMMLRTFLRNDQIAYPWLAAAGTRRGNIDNATNIGYINSTTGEFQTIKNRMSIRDVLYSHQINPLAFFTGIGLLNYGNKTSYDSQSSLDRVNVARLVCYIRERLQVAARPFVFEPNDNLTRAQLTGVVQSLFIDLVSKRGLYDYLVVCDTSNNTPARIDRNELWIDIAIEPVKAAEFIYIPVRLMNTGALSA
jgi:hypothetical protein